MFDFGITIRDLREKQGYSQTDVANRIGVSCSTVGRWEKDNLMPGTETLIDLSILYDVPLNYLVGEPLEDTFYVDHLAPDQQDLILAIIAEFSHKPDRLATREYNGRQERIINALIREFYK